MLKRTRVGSRCVVATAMIGVLAGAAAANAQTIVNGGAITISSSWQGGEKIPNYDNPGTVWSTLISVTYPGIPGYALASLPLAIGAVYINYYNDYPGWIRMTNNFSWHFSDSRPRQFTLVIPAVG